MSNDDWYEQRKEADFNNQARIEADANYNREKGWAERQAVEAADQTAANIERARHSYGQAYSRNSGGSHSHSHRNRKRRVEHPAWLKVALCLVIFALEILSLHVTTINDYGWNSGGGVIILGLFAWLAMSLILRIVPLSWSTGRRKRQ